MKKKQASVLVISSGGVDSTVALFDSIRKYEKVYAVTFAYGQKHEKMENAAITAICKRAGVPLIHIPLGFMKKHFSSSLLRGDIPTGNYNKKNMASTVVPFRNGIMLSIAAGIAESMGCRYIVLGNHSGDHFLYPDCTEHFIEAMKEGIFTGTGKRVRVVSPFCLKDKRQIISYGNKIGVPFEMTYSCYNGGKFHCGECGTCRERRESFRQAKVFDPTKYLKGE